MAMFKSLMIPTVAIAVLATPVTAEALTLMNRDKVEHIFTIYEGNDEWSGKIEPGESLSNLCVSACSLSLDAKQDEEADFRGNEIVLIRHGKLILTE